MAVTISDLSLKGNYFRQLASFKKIKGTPF
ncbi:hypothetical protein DMNBHIDG_02232 [Candidatus Methanoperedenaceae archaeon GB37]|nr:hypothetical protein DMNBHIDG_02232 [Candidatus Methanoperedenaceae archaeon GB37]